MLTRTLLRLLGPAQRLCSTPDALVTTKSMRKYLDLNREMSRTQQVPMLLEELKEIHGLPGMVKNIERVMPEVRSRLQTATPNVGPKAYGALRILERLERVKHDESDAERYFRIFVMLVSSRWAVQQEVLALGRGLSVPHAQLQHDNLLACVQHLFDSDNCLSFDSGPERTNAETWLAWEHFHLGKMQGQDIEFYRHKGPPETFRVSDQTERLYKVLDGALGDERSYLAGNGAGKFSVADIAVFSWINVAYHSGINLERFPNIEAWWRRIWERPAIQYALARSLGALQRVPLREQEESQGMVCEKRYERQQ